MMYRIISVIIAVGAVLIGVLYQAKVENILFVVLGLGRTIQPIEDFPYECRRIRHTELESCEDLWLDEEYRTLYAACADSLGRLLWAPGAGNLEVHGRRRRDHISVLKIDEPGQDGLFGLHPLILPNEYKSSNGMKEIDLNGFDVEILPDSRLRFRLVNHRPPTNNATGRPINAKKHGANSTIEVFDLVRGSKQFQYVKTINDEAVFTPNAIIATGDGGFLVTNDHKSKAGSFRDLELITGGGNVAYCGPNNLCHKAADVDFANGITKGIDGLYYVISSSTGRVLVHDLEANKTLTKITEIPLWMGLDNLSIDKNGDIFAAGFPSFPKLLKAANDPLHVDPPSTVWRIRRKRGGEEGYKVEKVLEDRDAGFLPSTTTAVHDFKTGRFFLSGVTSPFITVCEKKSG